MLKYDHAAAHEAFEASWSLESAKQWSVENPAAGQCNVTAAVAFSLFGGDILRTDAQGGWHYYNRIDGCVVDFTASQFPESISYENKPSSLDEALNGIRKAEFDALRRAFVKNYQTMKEQVR